MPLSLKPFDQSFWNFVSSICFICICVCPSNKRYLKKYGCHQPIWNKLLFDMLSNGWLLACYDNSSQPLAGAIAKSQSLAVTNKKYIYHTSFDVLYVQQPNNFALRCNIASHLDFLVLGLIGKNYFHELVSGFLIHIHPIGLARIWYALIIKKILTFQNQIAARCQ